MQRKTIALSVALAAAVVAAVYPHVDAYRKSLPVELTTKQAGMRYMEAVCPDILVVNQANSVVKKIKYEQSQSYPEGSYALSRAVARVGALNNNLISLTHRRVQTLRDSSRVLLDKKYIWPESIRKDVDTVANDNFALAGEYARYLRDGGEVKDPNDNNAADRVRLRLNLPVRGEGCPSKPSK
jgi:hypothetical protein